MCNQLDVLQWLNSFYDNNTNFRREEINVVTDFSLLWNLFESIFAEVRNGERLSINCNRLTSISQIVWRKANVGRQIDFYEEYYRYFRDRYVTQNNTTNELFGGLRIQSEAYKNLVKDVLTGVVQTPKKIIEAILVIIYRFRNNLFHGEKDLHNIHTQYDNFKKANGFLTKILEINKNT